MQVHEGSWMIQGSWMIHEQIDSWMVHELIFQELFQKAAI